MTWRLPCVVARCALLGACGTEPSLGAGPGRLTNSSTGTGATSTSAETSATSEAEAETETSAGSIKFDLAPPPDLSATAEIPESCETAADVESAVGCVFFSVDLDNAYSADDQQFGVVVSNVQLDQPTTVVVEVRDGPDWSPVTEPVEIAALSSAQIELPDTHQEGSGVRVGGAFRVTSDRPVVAYQFNPIDGQISHSTDASLLLPVTSWDYLYRVLGYPVTLHEGSYVTVVAAVDGTVVEVVPNDPVAAGPEIPATPPSIAFEIELDAGDYAQIATEQIGDTLTGTRISADKDHPVGVFSGTECTNTGMGACDHLEDMLIGLRQWGTRFVAARPPHRLDTPEPAIWQIYASEDNTYVQLEATDGVTGLPATEFYLDAGQTGRFPVTGPSDEPGDFFVQTNKPIALVAYMIGIAGGQGDPAMVQMSPTAQFLPRYVVLVPETWANDLLVITRPFAAPVTIDGELVDDALFVEVGVGDWEVARVGVADGVHVIDGLGQAIGVSVVGYDQHDSYAYIGGMGTVILNPSPTG